MDDQYITKLTCNERHGRIKDDVTILFSKVDTVDKKKISKELCEERYKNMEAEMIRISSEIKGTKNLIITNIIIVITVGIFMTGIGTIGKSYSEKEIAGLMENFISEQKTINNNLSVLISKTNSNNMR